MDAAVRHLRVTRSDNAELALFLLIQDDLQSLGQQVVYREVLISTVHLLPLETKLSDSSVVV